MSTSKDITIGPISMPRKDLTKFAMVLGIVFAYFLYLSWHFDLKTGGVVAALSWSFFVLCTPVADAGFLLDSPVRLITGIRMIFSEIIVWALAITLNIATLTLSPASYQTDILTKLLYQILTQPWPYWSIIVICCAGTFLSIYFGDKVMDAIAEEEDILTGKRDAAKTKLPWKKIIFTAIGAAAVIAFYYYLIRQLGIELPS